MKQFNAYLTFDGNTREAMQFYADGLGAQLHMMTFGESPMHSAPEAKDRIMHASLTKGSAILMASDSMPGMPFQQGNNVWINIDCEDAAEIDRYFAAFSRGARAIVMPLQETFWAARFGMLTDKFGIHWMFNLGKPHQA